MNRTDYSKIASTYNKRYEVNYLPNIEKLLKQLISKNKSKNILEAGCGTGRWIQTLAEPDINVYGLDYSLAMLKTFKSTTRIKILNADADYIPFKNNFFDLIFCVNAIHHFPDKQRFIAECKRALKQNGVLAVFGVDPHIDKDWYVYDYFENVYQKDLKRFPSLKDLEKNLISGGFNNVNIKIAEEVLNEHIGSEVFNDPFLEKNHSSQLANLTEIEYQSGIEKIKAKIEQEPNYVFRTNVIFYLISAKTQE